MEKKRLEDLQMELRNKIRQKDDLEGRQEFELKVTVEYNNFILKTPLLNQRSRYNNIFFQMYKEKVKHLLHEQNAQITDIKLNGERALTLAQDDNRYNKYHI